MSNPDTVSDLSTSALCSAWKGGAEHGLDPAVTPPLRPATTSPKHQALMPGENVISATARAIPGDGHCLYHCLSDRGGSPSDRMDVVTRERMKAAAR